MTPTLRSAHVVDAPAVLALWREAQAEPSRTDDRESITSLIRHDPSALVVAESAGQIVGSVVAAWDGWRGSIYRLAVAPSHRRMGLGRRLVSEAEQRLARAGAVRCQAIVVESDAVATAFWRTSGWEQQAERLRFVKG
jgi:ribosomal protein S18 acetylase RimI-like enzyme